MATAIDIGWSALGAFIVGLVFALIGAICAITTFFVNDTIQRESGSRSIFRNPNIDERSDSNRIDYTPAHK